MKQFLLSLYNLLLISLISLLLLSCKNQEVSEDIDEVIIFSEKGMGKISSLIEKVDFIALENSDETIMREASKILVEHDRIYIHDSFTQKLVVFNDHGEHLFTIDKKGGGPEEYIELKNLTMDEENFYFIDNYTNKLRLYDKYSGLYKDKLDLPFVVDDIALFDNGDFLFCVSPYGGDYNIKQTRHRLFITDNSLNIKARLFSYEKNHDDPIDKQYYFTINDNYIYYNVAMQDYFYSFSKSEFQGYNTYFVDFGDGAIPEKYRNDYQASDPYRFIYETPYVIDGYRLFDINMDDYLEVFIYNDKEKKWYVNDNTQRFNFVLPIKYAKGKTIYGILFEGFDSYQTLVNNGFKRASLELENHLKDEGWVIVKYTLK